MTAERWDQMRAIFLEALQRPPDDRPAFLEEACAGDPDLRDEVWSLLEADEQTSPMDAAGGIVPLLAGMPGVPVEGQRVGPYEILHEIGRGGMGIVYKAHDHRLDRFVALKFLPPHLDADAEAKSRFVAEAKAASALDHANICTIYEIADTEDGRLFIAMAYYEGETLKQRIKQGPLPVKQAVAVVIQAARGLCRAHEAGILHRDVKPANLMVTRHGDVKVLDFGIAKLEGMADMTRPEARLGTVAYMSPEQTRGTAVDQRTDIWALGIVLYELLTGERPFTGDAFEVVIHAVRHDAPRPLAELRRGAPPALARIIDRMLAKEPNDRYPDMAALLADLEALEAGRQLSIQPLRRHRTVLYGGALVLVILGLLFLGRQHLVPAHEAPLRSIAVLPMANFSGDPGQEYFADGMTEALIGELARIEALRVISRTSVMPFKGTRKPIRAIAQELNVDAFVEGSVTLTDDRVGLTAKLIDARTDATIWTQSYDVPLRDIVALQHELALSITREIRAALTPEAETHLAGADAVNPNAYRLYLYGQHFRNHEAPESWRRAVDYFEQALAQDSAFAPAYAGLSRVLTHTMNAPEPARQAAERALVLDPTLSDAHVSLGLLREMLDWNWAGAEEAFRSAVRLNPNDAEAHHELGMLLMRTRRFDAALTAAQRALDLDPLSVRFLNGVAAVYLFSGQYAQAEMLLLQSLQLEPDGPMTYWHLGQAYQETGRLDEAISAFETMIELGGYQPQGHLGHAYASAGRTDETRREIDRLRAAYEQASGSDAGWLCWNLALVHTGLGEAGQALDWLELAYAERTNVLMYLNIVPAFAPLYDHPRFRALLDEVGLRTTTDH